MTSSDPITKADSPATTKECEVLVIGGGPAGSTISAFLTKKGRKVVLIEKEHHPRFHIGESLLPMNMPIFERLGVADKVQEIGMLKPGAEFNHEGHQPALYYFRNQMNKAYPIAYQVKRSEFDHMLLKNSADIGTEVREGERVADVTLGHGLNVLVDTIDEQGNKTQWQAKFLIDASGRDTFLANRYKMKARNSEHNSSAIFGHFSGAEWRDGEDAGNISVYWFDHGWYWFIPLRDGTTSVGAVCWPYYLMSRKNSVDKFLWDTIKLNELLYDRLKNAKLTGPARATGNFSYQAERMGGDNYLLVGDSFAFIDPVFSSGVFLAMSGAELGAEVVDKALSDGKLSPSSLVRYERTIKQGLKTFSWFIYRITTPALRGMFMSPRNVFRMEEAILSLLSADIYGRTPIRMPLLIFKLIYYMSSVLNWRESWRSYHQRKRAWRSRLDYIWKVGA
jgi:flavin-dependent dehydrogenase